MRSFDVDVEHAFHAYGRGTGKTWPIFQFSLEKFLKYSAAFSRYLPKPTMPTKLDLNPGDDSLATRASLLGRLKNWQDTQSWEEFTQTYSRLIRAVALKAGLSESEARDVEQETLLCVAKTIHEFESNPERGTFKSWLLNLTRWRITDQFRSRNPASVSGPPSDATSTSSADRVPGPDNLDQAWEVEWKRNIVETALARVSRKVKPKHLQIFDLYAMRHWPAGKVARELGITRVQVYLVNHRLTKLIKREVEYLGENLE
jgi:RNA polymerase sigma factor (sigma-70 family)